MQEDLRDLMILRTPVAQIYNMNEVGRAAAAPEKKRPPPLPQRNSVGAAAPRSRDAAPPTMASPPTPFPSTRVGLATTGGMGRSSVLFLVAVALAVLTMSAIALAVVVPSAEWSFLQG